MDVRVLRYFLRVAQEENITRAAVALYTTQSNLSRQLAQLEKEIGKRLFERGSRTITLTEDGMFLRKRAQEIVTLVDRTEAELATAGDVVSGSVSIGAAETHAMRLIADGMLALKTMHPQIHFELFSGSTIEVTEGLNKGLLDFGILVEPVNLDRYAYLRLPITDLFGLVMRKDNPLAQLEVIRPADLKGQPVLCAVQQLDGNVFAGWLGEDINNLDIVATFNLITTPVMMVQAGLGSAFTFDRLVNTSADSDVCFRPLEPRIEAGLVLAWQKAQVFTKAARAFLDQMQDTFAAASG
jgi:DNA-binding transcriptional LysR family regulator